VRSDAFFILKVITLIGGPAVSSNDVVFLWANPDDEIQRPAPGFLRRLRRHAQRRRPLSAVPAANVPIRRPCHSRNP
jgi:hypothetical protein